MKLLVPLIFAAVGVGAGVGAGIVLRPDASAETAAAAGDEQTPGDAKAGAADKSVEDAAGAEYVHFKNQFIVPILREAEVTSFVILSLDLEVVEGASETVNRAEPKIRDALLTVLFDHANAGGFEGRFTSSGAMNDLRAALREAARKAVGGDMLTDVLITSVVRQRV
jgi:flagellar basal body-associated protein FliL